MKMILVVKKKRKKNRASHARTRWHKETYRGNGWRDIEGMSTLRWTRFADFRKSTEI